MVIIGLVNGSEEKFNEKGFPFYDCALPQTLFYFRFYAIEIYFSFELALMSLPKMQTFVIFFINIKI